MPPKRAAAAKRKAQPPSDEDPVTDGDDDDAGSSEGSSHPRPAKKQKPSTKATGSRVKKGSDGATAKGKSKVKAKAKRTPASAGGGAKTKKAHESEDEYEEESGAASEAASPRTGASTSAGGTVKLAPNGQPINKVLPVRISFPEKVEGSGTVRVATWNICGLAAAQKKGFKYYVEAEDADVLILTETKVNNPPVDPSLADRYPHRYWAISDKKTYSGIAILSKVEPLSVTYDLPGHPDGSAVKGRIVTLEFEGCYVTGTYVTNAGTGLKTLDAKKLWNKHFEVYIRELDKKKPVIWAGDLNVAPTALDLANPKTNWNKTPGYTETETSSFARILNAEDQVPDAGRFLDIWRRRHPDLRHYTYFSYRFNCREKGLGWRLDMFVVSERLEERVKMCEIRSEIYGASDHCPVVLELEGPL